MNELIMVAVRIRITVVEDFKIYCLNL